MADKVLGYVPGQPMQSDMASVSPKDPGAKAPKPTSVSAMTPMGARVNPGHTNGGVTDPLAPYPAHSTEWAVESGSHS